MFDELKPEPVTILIVDDQPISIRIIRDTVSDLGKVIFATSGLAAIEIVKRSPPDIVLLDIEMPGMDGFAVCKAITGDPATKDVAIIFITAHDQDSQEINALGMGGVDFLNKPLNVPIARARIEMHLALRLKNKQLIEARRSLENVVQNIPAFISQWDKELRNVFTNDLGEKWLGMRGSHMVGLHLRDILGETNFFAIEQHFDAMLYGVNTSFDISLIRPDGDTLHGQASVVYHNVENRDDGFLLLITDVTDRKHAETALYREKERIRITLNSISDAVIATDVGGLISFLNPIAEEMTGWKVEEALGQTIEAVMPLRETSTERELHNPIRIALSQRRTVGMTLNARLVRRDGSTLEVEDSAAPIFDSDNELTGAITVFHDVSEARALAIKMAHLANHDALTNLPNHMLLRDRTEQAIRDAKRVGCRVAFLFFDLDHFKSINDASGHSTGDQLLQQVASRLKKSMRGNDTVSRQGGDEFIGLLHNIQKIEDVATAAENFLAFLSEPYWIENNRYDLTVSIGISLFPDDSDNMATLYHQADAAMYRAKQDGRNRFQFFCTEIEDSLRSCHLLERRMRVAVENQEFEVYYQPKVDAKHSTIIGAEALVRWRRSDGQLISPAEFIPMAEETGLIVPIGLDVLRKACLAGVKWHAEGFHILIAVNVSLVQMGEVNFVDSVKGVLKETGIAPELLELEITEAVFASDMIRTRDSLFDLKALGISIALDDFGIGYSSLAYLKRFPIDVLKIDQSFVRDMLTDNSDAGIVEAIVQMARSLSLSLVAEGVEQEAQAQALLALGCQVMQGYLYGRPMPMQDFEAFLFRGIG
ncbi:hypothetical protein ALP10_200150 [Pseudomonas syringae pv. helianthi]|uniref:Uncharacterized protein n=1 Tax=Pseudomonas syringae pv. helianthi TaxID=251654 RepID=A0A3M6CFW0_9PSED|nr:EAL domain-containing protein [Pseudomonas syringae group genomosp. 7]RMV42745.1 hypothetical protein ALP10_200150 [Pseudomonas syringae pv. helianthi]